jgi:probable HAF family extracellular repeat protein
MGINSAGDIVGYYCVCDCEIDHAFVWTAETGLTELPMPPGTTSSEAWDINDDGWIAGWLNNPGSGLGALAFLTDGDHFVEIPPPTGGTYSHAYAINSTGKVVGSTHNPPTNSSEAFLWHEGLMTILGPFPIAWSSGSGINDVDQVVGWMGDTSHLNPTARGFIWDDGEVTTLGPIPGGDTSEPYAINNLGQVVGLGLILDPNGGGFVRHAFLYTEGEMLDLGTLPGYERSWALDINDIGDVVGRCSHPDPNDWRAFIWKSGVMTDLNDLIPPDADVLVTLATGINSTGQISGWARMPAPYGTGVAVLLTPRRPPLGDLDGDCTVGIIDFLMLLGAWGRCPDPCPPTCPADLDGDCNVGITDLLILLANWG